MSYSWFLGSVAHSLTSCQEQLHPSVHNEMNANLDLPEENSKQTRKAKITDTLSIITGKQKCVHSTKKRLTKTKVSCPNTGRTRQRKPVQPISESRAHFLPQPSKTGISKMCKAKSVTMLQPLPGFHCSQEVTLSLACGKSGWSEPIMRPHFPCRAVGSGP